MARYFFEPKPATSRPCSSLGWRRRGGANALRASMTCQPYTTLAGETRCVNSCVQRRSLAWWGCRERSCMFAPPLAQTRAHDWATQYTHMDTDGHCSAGAASARPCSARRPSSAEHLSNIALSRYFVNRSAGFRDPSTFEIVTSLLRAFS